MTADIRTAAQREVERIMPFDGGGMDALRAEWRNAFPLGGVWAAKRVTPTRDQIAEALRHGGVEIGYAGGHSLRLHAADAVLALMQELAEGERS